MTISNRDLDIECMTRVQLKDECMRLRQKVKELESIVRIEHEKIDELDGPLIKLFRD